MSKSLTVLKPCSRLCNVTSVCLSTTAKREKSYKVVVVGGGAGGCAVAAKFSKKLGKGKVAVIEPTDTHYYQPMWTLVGGGMKTLDQSKRSMQQVLPSNADWIKEKAVQFKPDENKVVTSDGNEVEYENLVVTMGLQLKYNEIKGLPEAFETPGVCSNYSYLYVDKTWKNMQEFKGGNAVFSFPAVPIKCAGAPQKIMYIFEDYQKKNGRAANTNITFNSGLGVLFSSKYYADALWKIIEGRGINANLRTNLVEVNPDKKEAIFQNLDKPDEKKAYPYDFLHVTPPMYAPDELRSSSLVDGAGFLDVNKETLQHTKYKNIFGIGDCINAPTSKTAAAVAGQFGVLHKNLSDYMNGIQLHNVYDGYTSCPLITGYSTAVMAEFDYSTGPLETFPFDQREERKTMFLLKKSIMPTLYWNFMLKGRWEGPHRFRKIMHMGRK